MKKDPKKQVEDSYLMIEPLAVAAVENAKVQGSEENPILQLQLTMATSSINHEYARIEFEDTRDHDRKEELLDYMSDCRKKYFEARDTLSIYDSEALRDFENDLRQQKLETLHRFNA